MITKEPSFKTSDGTCFLNLEEARRHEIQILISAAPKGEEVTVQEWCLTFIFRNTDAIVDILTTGPKSRTKTRADKGTKRKPKAAREQAVEGAKV